MAKWLVQALRSGCATLAQWLCTLRKVISQQRQGQLIQAQVQQRDITEHYIKHPLCQGVYKLVSPLSTLAQALRSGCAPCAVAVHLAQALREAIAL